MENRSADSETFQTSQLLDDKSAQAPPAYSGGPTQATDDKHAPPGYTDQSSTNHLGESDSTAQPSNRKSSSTAIPLQTVTFKYHGGMMNKMSVNEADSTDEIFYVELKLTKPHMVFYAPVEDESSSAAPVPSSETTASPPQKKGFFSRFKSKDSSSDQNKEGKVVMAEVNFHTTTRRMDCIIRGKEVSLKPGRWFKEDFTYTSITGAARKWRNLNCWRSLDMVCVDEAEGDPEVEAQKTGGHDRTKETGTIVARLRVDDWYKLKLGSLEMFDPHAANMTVSSRDVKSSMATSAEKSGVTQEEIEESIVLGTALSYYKLMTMSTTMPALAYGASKKN